MNKIRKCQELLLLWIVVKEKVSYQAISKRCDYLNYQYDLGIKKHPIRRLLFPLFLRGNIEYCDRNYFKATEPILITNKSRYVFTNICDSKELSNIPMIFKSIEKPKYKFSKEYVFNAITILKHFPSIDKVMNTFSQMSLVDVTSLIYEQKSKEYGIAKKDAPFSNWYFVYPKFSGKAGKVVSVPDWNINPDSLNIAHCYSRTFEKQENGRYILDFKTLKVHYFRFPIMLYRVLMIESLLNDSDPYYSDGYYVFPNIEWKIVKELNRILCNSISYE